MLNGITGAGAVCCQYSPEGAQVSGGVGGSGGGSGGNRNGGTNTRRVNVGGVGANIPRSAGGLLAQIGEALDQAIHGGDSGSSNSGRLQAQRLLNSAARSFSGGANVIPFPMVNPFKPIVATRAPATGLTRFPKRFTYEFENTASEPDDEQSSLDGVGGLSGLDGLGYSWADFGNQLQYPSTEFPMSSGPSKLQTILGTIQATLPATIQAFRAQPANIFPGATYNPYASNAGGLYPGSVPVVAVGTGGPAAGVGAGVGSAVDTLGGTVSRFVSEHPYMVIAGGAALVLLFMNPPRRR